MYGEARKKKVKKLLKKGKKPKQAYAMAKKHGAVGQARPSRWIQKVRKRHADV